MRSKGLLTSREIRSITLFVMKTLNNISHGFESYLVCAQIRFHPQTPMKTVAGASFFATYLFIKQD